MNFDISDNGSLEIENEYDYIKYIQSINTNKVFTLDNIFPHLLFMFNYIADYIDWNFNITKNYIFIFVNNTFPEAIKSF